MKIGYFECFSGASGDMILGALIDAGVSVAELNALFAGFGPYPIEIQAQETSRGQLRGIQVRVSCPREEHAHRTFLDIGRLIRGSRLPSPIQDASLRVFQRLAEAEGKLHSRPPEKVTFHEVGAIDSIVDIVGAAAGIQLLGLERVYVSAFPLGRGFVQSGHGVLPLPAPATLELLRGFETVRTDTEGEWVTPTGAAVLTTLAVQEVPPPFVCESVGYGAGTEEREDVPNLLRLSVGRARTDLLPSAGRDQVWVIETNVDDMSPELCGYLYDRLFAAGALDVYVTPVQMKKSRPGIMITCLAPLGAEMKVEETLFNETSTFGLRKHLVERTKLLRETRTVRTPHGDVRVKVGILGGVVKTVSPEYEDCRAIAEKCGIPLRDLYAEVCRLAREADSPLAPDKA